MGHVDVHAHAVVQHVGQLRGSGLTGAGVVLLAPVIEPAVPELHAHLGLARQLALGHLQHLQGAGAEVHGGQRSLDGAAGEPHAGGPVGGHQQFVDAALTQAVAQVGQVRLVVAVAAVLVLHLHHDHVASAGGLPGGDHGDQQVEPRVDKRQVAGIADPQAQVAVAQDPAGEPAVLPLGADVGARPHNRIQPLLPGDVQEAAQVADAGEAGGLRGGLVHVPGHVGLHRVAAHRDQAAQAVAPLLGVHAEVVDGTGDHQVLLTSAQEAVGGGFEQGGHRWSPSVVNRLTHSLSGGGGRSVGPQPGWDWAGLGRAGQAWVRAAASAHRPASS